MTPMEVKRGEIYYANLDPVIGNETGKTLPVLIIQNDIGNTYSPTKIVAIITEYSDKKASYPICVAVPKSKNMRKDSIVNLSQIRNIDKNRLPAPRLTCLSTALMKKVDDALGHSLAL